ncbi:MAG TPA: hypothetical protein VJY65_04715, partial [Chloroflexota bacterium]|nr:hypothetical protein [Chloroflexota bacterium]
YAHGSSAAQQPARRLAQRGPHAAARAGRAAETEGRGALQQAGTAIGRTPDRASIAGCRVRLTSY